MQYFKTNNKHFKGIMRRHETVDTLGTGTNCEN